MRWFSLLLVLPACDPTLHPDPPQLISSRAEALSAGYGHVVAVVEGDNLDPGGVRALAGAIPQPFIDDDADGVQDPLELPAIRDVAAGRRHGCALTLTGTVVCWGDQSGGAVGPNRTCTPPPEGSNIPDCIVGPGRTPELPRVRELTAGDDVTCVTIEEGDAVFCWGDAGRVGGSNVPVFDRPAPVRLPDGTALAAARVLAIGGAMCAIDHEGALWCWGDGFGRLPERQPQVGVVDLSVGEHHTCLIDERGLSCWGDNRNGQVGDLAAARACPLSEPCRIDEPYRIDIDAVRVVAGERHTCVLGRDGRVTCFGSNEVGQLGRDDAFLVGDHGPVLADGFTLAGVTDLAGGGTYTCAMRGQTHLWCWGSSIGVTP